MIHEKYVTQRKRTNVPMHIFFATLSPVLKDQIPIAVAMSLL